MKNNIFEKVKFCKKYSILSNKRNRKILYAIRKINFINISITKRIYSSASYVLQELEFAGILKRTEKATTEIKKYLGYLSKKTNRRASEILRKTKFYVLNEEYSELYDYIINNEMTEDEKKEVDQKIEDILKAINKYDKNKRILEKYKKQIKGVTGSDI